MGSSGLAITVNNNNTGMMDNTFQRFVLVIISGCLSLAMSYSAGGYLPPVRPGHVSRAHSGHVSQGYPGHVSSLNPEYNSPVQVPREICYNPSTGERCDNYNKQFADSYPVRCSQ